MTMDLLISPAERGRVLSEVSTLVAAQGGEAVLSSLPERMGVDYAWMIELASGVSWYGVQRKTFKDYLASLNDGRLARELPMMAHAVDHSWLVLEGRERWTLNDTMDVGRQTVTKTQWYGSMWSLIAAGVHVFPAHDEAQTARMIVTLMDWSARPKHLTALARPKAAGEWGKATSAEWAAHLLQGFEGIGPDTARAIVSHFGGVPLSWDISEAELMKVPGVGKGRAASLVRALAVRIKKG